MHLQRENNDVLYSCSFFLGGGCLVEGSPGTYNTLSFMKCCARCFKNSDSICFIECSYLGGEYLSQVKTLIGKLCFFLNCKG